MSSPPTGIVTFLAGSLGEEAYLQGDFTLSIDQAIAMALHAEP
jgi:hypothetical protein